MNFWETFLAIIAGFGGFSGLIVLVVKFCSNIIADRLEKKYELKLNKELEKYKTNLENKTYISKTKFDTEFNIYKELSKAFFELDARVNTLIPPGYSTILADKKAQEEVDKENFKEMMKAYDQARDVLFANTPFIKQEFIDEYLELLKLTSKQKYSFEQRWMVSNFCKDKGVLDIEDYERSEELHKKLMDLNGKIRDYLNTLDVIE